MARDGDRNGDPEFDQSQSWAVTSTGGLRGLLGTSQRCSSKRAVAGVFVERTVGLCLVVDSCLLGVLQSPRDGVGGGCGVVGETEVLRAGRRKRLFQEPAALPMRAEGWLTDAATATTESDASRPLDVLREFVSKNK